MLDYKKTGVKLLALAGVFILVFGAISLGIYFWPFVIGIVFAALLEKPVEAVVKKTKISRKIIGTIFVFLTFIIIGAVIALAITSLVNEAINLSGKIPNIYENLKIEYKTVFTSITELLDRTPTAVSDSIYNIGLNVLSKLAELTTKLANAIVNFIMFVPNILIYIIVTLLATLFLVIDRRTITKFMTDILPNSWVKKITDVIAKCFISLSGYLKALLILITVTFVELLIAFIILDVEYPLLIAVIGAIIDALPILGISALLLPWAIYSAITGELGFGIALVILYLIMTVIRQLIEPKVVSNNIGTHPFITLLCMYLGFKVLGIAGLLVGPILMIIFKNVFSTMFKTGYFKNIFILKKEKKIKEEK